MLRGSLVKRAGSHHDGVCRCPEEPHNKTVRFGESADVASPRFAGDFVADYAVNRAHEVADHIGPLGAEWREPQIAAVGKFAIPLAERLAWVFLAGRSACGWFLARATPRAACESPPILRRALW